MCQQALKRGQTADARHRYVHYQNVRVVFVPGLDCGLATVGFGHHGRACAFNEQAKPHAYDGVVVRQHDAQGVEFDHVRTDPQRA